MGVVSPIAGFGGIMQAISVVNIVLGCDNKIFREIIIFDGFSRNMKKIKVKKKVQNVKYVITNIHFFFYFNQIWWCFVSQERINIF